MSNLPLTKDQRAAYVAFVGFINNPKETYFVIKGYAGTGKSTLVSHLLSQLDATLAGAKLITQEDRDWTVTLTATTNKAAEALSLVTNEPVKTIQSFLGLKPQKSKIGDSTILVTTPKTKQIVDHILFIDEASFADNKLLDLIQKHTKYSKVIYIGDPAQLTPIKTTTAPVFNQGYPEVELTEVVRQQKDNPITNLATSFRNMVNGQGSFSFTPDGHHVQHMSQEDFQTKILKNFNDPEFIPGSAKVLAWTNKTVIGYNQAIREAVDGLPDLQEGDYAICNTYINCVTRHGTCRLSADNSVLITKIMPAVEFETKGWVITMNETHRAFMPISLKEKKKTLKDFKKAYQEESATYGARSSIALERKKEIKAIEENWIDLRAAYSCTVNKSQGSTYDNVYIDLNDIGKCNSGNTIARMLYVAVSRAKHHVYLTGDWN